MTNKTIVALPFAASLLFWASLFGFAALNPGYSHFTKAVSELGVWGAPHMWWFNLFGYILPGVLLASFGWTFGRRIAPRGIALPLLLASGGLGFVIAGVFPADMANMESATTRLHISGTFIGLGWALGLVMLALRVRGEWSDAAITSILALVAVIIGFGLYDAPFTTRAVVQRLNFAVIFGWHMVAALLLLRRA